ncbi:TIGR03086 family metal-binding protein [Nocardioides sp.]|uniref:TIGR03086 family metal-binding protein n=1 Tax=Nocardioides sp. TaxID=35761 RepID=UPI001A285601|nr:TIGR03086 family metal-binding protein [Nocardioides sp.]MBJ7357060.1 TIGR03086 family protein [Nocardioides sp.]
MTDEQTPAEEWREIGAGFTARVDAVDDDGWGAPAPVAGWTARDVVRHLVEWFPAFLESGSGIRLEVPTSVDDDPAAAWHELERGVRALLDDPGTQAVVMDNPHIGEVPVDRAVSQFFTADVFMHTWDLARATGQDDRLDPDRCAALLAGMEPAEDAMRASGHYGPRVAVPTDADPQTRLLGFIGRDPGWRATVRR